MRVLIVKTSSLGDIVQAFPVIDYIKNHFSDVQIDWVVEKPFADLVQSHPSLTKVWCIDTKKWKRSLLSKSTRREIKNFKNDFQKVSYDIVFDLQGNSKSGLITSLAVSPKKVGFSWSCVAEWPNLLCTNHKIFIPNGKTIRETYLYMIQSYFNCSETFLPIAVRLNIKHEEEVALESMLKPFKDKQRPLVLICPGSAWKNKQLPQKTMLDFLRLLQNKKQCFYLFAWGSEKEKVETEYLHSHFPMSAVLDRFSLPCLQRVIEEMDLVIAMDSLPLHLAATTSTPTFSLFGPSLASKYAPNGVQHVAVQGKCPYGRIFEKRCPVLRTCPTGACMQDFKPEHLVDLCP